MIERSSRKIRQAFCCAPCVRRKSRQGSAAVSTNFGEPLVATMTNSQLYVGLSGCFCPPVLCQTIVQMYCHPQSSIIPRASRQMSLRCPKEHRAVVRSFVVKDPTDLLLYLGHGHGTVGRAINRPRRIDDQCQKSTVWSMDRFGVLKILNGSMDYLS